MHPETAKTLAAQRHSELEHGTAASRRGRRFVPRWHVSWTRTMLAPAGAPATAYNSQPSRRGRRRGSSLVIIISAHRSA
jgi:hypothetical protein